MNGGKLVIGIEANTKKFDVQIEQTKNKIKELEEIAETMKKHIDIGDNAQQLEKVNVEIEKTKNQLVNLETQQRKNEAINFSNPLRGLKKFAMGLIGIRGIYSMVRKASSAWLSQDTELAKKFQSIWTGLGAMLAPVLEALANIMMKLLGYLNVFIKAFTGGKVDLIANANAKAIKNQANAMKELKNQTYGFDELNIQQVNDTSGSGGSSFGGIPNIELDPRIESFVKRIGEFLGDIWNTLVDFTNWIAENLGEEGAIALGIAAIIGFGLVSGGGAGLLGIVATLLVIKGLMEWFEAKNMFNKNTQGMTEHSKKVDTVTTSYNELAKAGKMTDQELKDWEKDLKTLNGSTKDYSNSLKNTNNSLGLFGGSVGDITVRQLQLYQQTNSLIESYRTMAETTGLSEEAANDYMEALETQRTILKNLGSDTLVVDAEMAKLKDQMGKLDKSQSNPKITYKVFNEDKTKPITLKVNTKVTGDLSGIVTGKSKGGNIINLSNVVSGIATFFSATGGILNKCAAGSIVNNPGRGVYVGGNTIAGEAGKEGIIPLTDPNAMAELGETIGKYITVNLTNVTKLDSKTINKETTRIANDNDFIRNGGVA